MGRFRVTARRVLDRLPDPLIQGPAYRMDLRRRAAAARLDYDLPLVVWSDDWLTYSIARSGSYELTQKHFIASVLLPRMADRNTAIDVGSNVGTYSVFLSRYFDRVLAFDPSVEASRLLGLTLEMSGIGNVEVSVAALGEKNGEGHLIFPPHEIPNRGMARMVPPHTTDSGEESGVVRILRGDDQPPPDATVNFIKVDVEGGEMSVLKGFSAVIRRDQPVLAVEVLSPMAASSVSELLPSNYLGCGLLKGRKIRRLALLSEIRDFESLNLAYFVPEALGKQIIGSVVPELG